MLPKLTTGASLLVKIVTQEGEESTIGFASRLNYSVSNGQKLIFTVDSPFPQEIAHGASQSFVKGTMTVYMLRGESLETMGISPYRQDANKAASLGPLSKYFHLRIYDRHTGGKVLSLDWCKVSGYSVDMSIRSITTASVSFEGMFTSPGDNLT